MWLEVFRVTENMMPWPDFLANHNTGDLHGDVAFMSRGSGRFFNFSFSPVRLSTQPSSICLTCEVLVRSSRATASRSRRSTSPTCSGRPPARPSSLRTRPFQTTSVATAAATTTTAPATTGPARRPPTRWPGRTTPASATTGSTGSLRTRPPRRSSKSAEVRPQNRWGEKRRQREGSRGWTATARRPLWPPPPSTPGSCRSCCQCTQPSLVLCTDACASADLVQGWLLISRWLRNAGSTPGTRRPRHPRLRWPTAAGTTSPRARSAQTTGRQSGRTAAPGAETRERARPSFSVPLASRRPPQLPEVVWAAVARHMLYGPGLLAAGWNNSDASPTPNSRIEGNAAAARKAMDALTTRCCGC